MQYMGIEYTIHRGPRGWAWKIYADPKRPRKLVKVGGTETKQQAILMAQTMIDELLSSDSQSLQRHESAA